MPNNVSYSSFPSEIWRTCIFLHVLLLWGHYAQINVFDGLLTQKLFACNFLFNLEEIVDIIKVEMFCSSFLKNTVALAYSQTEVIIILLKIFSSFSIAFQANHEPFWQLL